MYSDVTIFQNSVNYRIMIYPYSKKAEVLNTTEATGYLLAETENNDIVELHIFENGLVPAHSLPIDVTFYVISGKGSITVSDDKAEANQGDVIVVKRNQERIWQNPFSETLKLLVIKQKA